MGSFPQELHQATASMGGWISQAWISRWARVKRKRSALALLGDVTPRLGGARRTFHKPAGLMQSSVTNFFASG
jgi:hypothetical protein